MTVWNHVINPHNCGVVLQDIKVGIKSCRGPKDKEISKESSVHTHTHTVPLHDEFSFRWLLEIKSSLLLQWWGTEAQKGRLAKSHLTGRTVSAFPFEVATNTVFPFHLMLSLVCTWDQGWQHAQLSWSLSYRECSKEPIYLKKEAPAFPKGSGDAILTVSRWIEVRGPN